MLPESVVLPLQDDTRIVKRTHEEDLQEGISPSTGSMPWSASTPTQSESEFRKTQPCLNTTFRS
jgi:hypothetical protein